MSASKPTKHIAAPIIGKMSLMGMLGKLILIEVSSDADIMEIGDVIGEKNNIIFSVQEPIYEPSSRFDSTFFLKINSLYQVRGVMQGVPGSVDNWIISRIDMMDIHLSIKERGALVSAQIQMLSSPRILKESNLIITSNKHEHKLREICDHKIILR